MAATPNHAPEDCVLDYTDTKSIYHHFRSFAKTAARSCNLLSSSSHSVEEVSSAYLSLSEGLEGLRRWLQEHSAFDPGLPWLATPYVLMILLVTSLAYAYILHYHQMSASSSRPGTTHCHSVIRIERSGWKRLRPTPEGTCLPANGSGSEFSYPWMFQ